ncbi:ABC transporter ATP-binding protein [Candidatus Microgenomates bacterium]|nr:ABC transporter ATP-binding protein [Candidatus Microgenomates bacterium]
MIVLKLDHVTKFYKTGPETGYTALNDVSFEIKTGDFVAIMGPSGSGKSTFMHIAGCLDTPSKGKVFLEGEDVSKLSETELAQIRNKKIGFVFQAFNLLPKTTALDNVALPLVYRGLPVSQRKEMAMAALKTVDLEKRAHHLSNQLSGGERQRVAIARALVTNPSIIFADEPTGNLDTKSSLEIMEIFRKLNREGRTIVLVTHEKEIADHAKSLIRIRDGRII